VQFEFSWELGPDDGRYVLRGHAGTPSHVVVTETLGAPQRWLMARRRAKSVSDEPEPAPVLVTRATVIGVDPFASAQAAKEWLRNADLEDQAAIALEHLNDMLYAHRVTAADPYVHEVARQQALVVRVGFGEGDRLSQGRWAQARELPEPRKRVRRAAAMRPQERLAALLAGRDAVLACEELTLRARLDLDRGRQREAALQLRVALEAAIAELASWVERRGVAKHLEALRDERPAVGAAANAALEGGLDDDAALAVEQALRKVEAALRARMAQGFEDSP